MKSPHDVPDEAGLRELFDASVEPASGPVLTKLAARAQDIPERVNRARWWVPRWVWAPALAGVGTIAVALGWPGAPSSESLATHSASPQLAKVAHAGQVEAQRLVPADLYQSVSGADVPPPLSAMAELDGDWDPDSNPTSDLGLDALQGPPADADLDAWLFATSTLLAEGG